MKKRTYLLALLLMLFCLAGCGGEEPAETDLPKSPERPAKTEEVALIPEDGVVKIEDETGTYEVVYAEGLKEITMDEETNVLVSADDENFIYTFENADRRLRTMKEGDVFCGILPESGEALAVVVERVEKNGSTVTVYGVQPTLEDLFETIEIEATYGADALVVDELAEGVTMEETPADPLLSAETPRATNLAANTGKGPTAQNLASQTVEINRTFTQALRVENDYTFVEGSVSETIESVTVSLDYTRGKNKVVASVITRTTDSLRADLGIQAGWEDDFKIGEFHVKTSIPFVTVPLELSVHVSFSGSVGGTFEYEQTRLSGSEVTATTMGVTHRDIDEVVSKDVKADFVNFQAEVKVGPQISIGVAVFKDLLRVDLALGMGVKIEAEYAPFEPWDEFADSCHDCGVCFDGEISLFAELVGSAKASFPGLEPVTASITMAEVTKKLNDFYVSLGPDGRADPRFGLGECPYRRYRTEVKVTSKYGEIYGAEVHAQYPDGRTDHQWADEFGMAVFWLPAGQNWLDAEYNERINGDYYTISEEPSRQEIELEFDQRVVIVCNFHKIDCTGEETSANYVPAAEFGAIYGRLVSACPQAEIYSATTWEEYDNPIRLYGGNEKKQLRPGDILIRLSVSHVAYETDGYHLAGRNNDIKLPPRKYSGYNSFDATVEMAVNSWEDETEFRTIGSVAYSLGTDMSNPFLPDVHWLTPGGKERILTRVYFKGFNDSGYLEYTDFFDEISYSYDDVYYESMPEVDYWTGREVLETDLYEWDYTYQFIVSHTREKNYYYEEHYSMWGNALIGYSMDCLMPHIQYALVH